MQRVPLREQGGVVLAQQKWSTWQEGAVSGWGWPREAGATEVGEGGRVCIGADSSAGFSLGGEEAERGHEAWRRRSESAMPPCPAPGRSRACLGKPPACVSLSEGNASWQMMPASAVALACGEAHGSCFCLGRDGASLVLGEQVLVFLEEVPHCRGGG